jgi:uncharacterized protein (TIGR03118 family)
MNSHLVIKDPATAASAVVAACTLTLAACGGGGGGGGGGMTMTTPPPAPGFADTALVTNSSTVVAGTTIIDSNLQNPWGIAYAPGGAFWISDEANSVTTLYTGTGQIETENASGLSTEAGITIPANSLSAPSNPTGQIYNPNPAEFGGASFILDGQGGTIAGWTGGAAAVTAYDDSVTNGTNHAVYKGLAIASANGADYLYATDFFNNKIDVFDVNFNLPAAMQHLFVDPNAMTGFAPFGITLVNGQLFVTYAMQLAPANSDEVIGAGLGYVDVFDTSGNFVSRFATQGALNAPWGVAVAPSGFGSMAGDVLIGNFGDGHINAFTAAGASVGALAVNNGGTVAIPGLWALVFGNGIDADKPATTLFYTAGFADQTDGVFGTITPAPASSSSSGGTNPY